MNLAKAAEPPIPRGSAIKKRVSVGEQDSPGNRKPKKELPSTENSTGLDPEFSMPPDSLNELQRQEESTRMGPTFQPNMLSFNDDQGLGGDSSLTGRPEFGFGPSYQPTMLPQAPSHFDDTPRYGESSNTYQELASAALREDSSSYNMQDAHMSSVGDRIDPSLMQEDENRQLAENATHAHPIPMDIDGENTLIDPALEQMDLDPRLAQPLPPAPESQPRGNDDIYRAVLPQNNDVGTAGQESFLDPALEGINGAQLNNETSQYDHPQSTERLAPESELPDADNSSILDSRSLNDQIQGSSISNGQSHHDQNSKPVIRDDLVEQNGLSGPTSASEAPPFSDSIPQTGMASNLPNEPRTMFASRYSIESMDLSVPSNSTRNGRPLDPSLMSPLHNKGRKRGTGATQRVIKRGRAPKKPEIASSVNGGNVMMTQIMTKLLGYKSKSPVVQREVGSKFGFNATEIMTPVFTKHLEIIPSIEDEVPTPIFSPISEVRPEELGIESISQKIEPISPTAEPGITAETLADGSSSSNNVTEGQQTRASTPISDLTEPNAALLVNDTLPAPAPREIRQSTRSVKSSKQAKASTPNNSSDARVTRSRRTSTALTPAPTTSVKPGTPDDPNGPNGVRKGSKKPRQSTTSNTSRRNSRETLTELPGAKPSVTKETQNEWEAQGMDEATWKAIQEARSEGLGLRARKGRTSV